MSKHSSRGAAWEKLRTQVLQRDNYTCSYCGKEATEVDHIVPKVAGGEDQATNLLSSCKPCNASKSDKINTRTNYYNKKWIDRL